MKKYLIEILLISFFLIANVGVYLYFENEIKLVKAEQLVAKKEAEEKAEMEAKKEAEEKERQEEEKELAEAKAGIQKAQAEAQKAQAEADRIKAENERERAKKEEQEEKARKKREEKERKEILGIHKYEVFEEKGVDYYRASDNAYSSGLGSSSYLLNIDSEEEWNVVKKKLNKNRWYFIGGYPNGLDRHPKDQTDYINGEEERFYKVQYTKNYGWVWFDISYNNGDSNGNAYQPDKAGYIIEYEEN